VAEEFGVPLFIQKIVDSGDEKMFASVGQTGDIDSNGDGKGVSPLQLRTAAMALLRHGSSMPSERRNQLMKVSVLFFVNICFLSVSGLGYACRFVVCCTSVLSLKSFIYCRQLKHTMEVGRFPERI
jgi:hypothetical protein